MTNRKKIRSFVALCLLACMVISMTACTGGGGEPTGTLSNQITYIVEVTAEDGSPLEGVGVYVYEDESRQELVWFAKTGSDGRITFSDAASDSFVAVLKDVPAGFRAKDCYALTGEATTIVLQGSAQPTDPGKTGFALGDKMADFTVTATDGTEYSLSELLAIKDAVVLNFFFMSCGPCQAEFPCLQQAFEQFSDRIAVLALNPVDTDEGAIEQFRADYGLTFPTAACDSAWESNMDLAGYPTTVVIDRTGTISLIHLGSIPDTQTFLNIFAYFTDENYQPGIVTDVESLPEAEIGTSAENPIYIRGKQQFQVTVDSGKAVYCDLYKLSNVILEIRDPDAYVIYKEETYYPSDGVLRVAVSSDDLFYPTQIVIGNSGSEEKTFAVSLTNPAGSYENPFSLELGEFTVDAEEGNDRGVFYTYTASEPGTLTLACLGSSNNVSYVYSLYNLDTYAYRNLESDAVTDPATGAVTLSIQVHRGDTVLFNVGVLPDDDNAYAAASFTFLASFVRGTEDPTELVYSVAITDESGNPLSGVTVSLTAQGSARTLKTDKNGIASVSLAPGSYSVTVSVPDGYKADAASYQLTQDSPALTVQLKKIQTRTYTVKTVDSSGNPIANVLVGINGNYGYTDTAGTITFTLPEGSYTAKITAPDGYTASQTSYSFGSSTTVTATLTKTDTSVQKITYTVKVVDSSANPVKNVLVTVSSTSSYTNASGIATFTLAKGSYTAKITVPDGYTASQTSYSFGSSTTVTATLTKTDTPAQKITYTVKVVDSSGNPVTGVQVSFGTAATVAVNSSGVATASLTPGTYTVTLSGSYQFSPASAELTATTTSVTITATPQSAGNSYKLYICDDPVPSLEIGTTTLPVGTSQSNYANGYCYFVFITDRSGEYEISASNSAELSDWGANTNFIPATPYATGSTIHLSVKDDQMNAGKQVNILAVKVTSGLVKCAVTIQRTGDVILTDEEKAEWIIYQPQTPPTPFTVSSGSNFVYVDITASTGSYNLVLGSDGYYHLGSANGPIMYVNLGPSPGSGYFSFYQMLGKGGSGGAGLKRYFYDENGKFIKKEDYTQCLSDYVDCRDTTTGVYPLTEDLKYMIQNGGEQKGWWDTTNANGNFLFSDVSGLNTEIAWMFNCCYIP
ncbi:MAG: carboxypeptidase regulatory-like domain-containing protein [Faecousia sp.]